MHAAFERSAQLTLHSALEPDSRSASKPLFDKPYNGLTPQQYAYCLNRADGMTKTEAYRLAFNSSAEPARLVQMGGETEAKPHVAATLSVMIAARQPQTTLVPMVDRNFVKAGILSIATKETAKDNVRLRAFELLGKMPEINLFTAEVAPPKPRTLAEVEAELKKHLAALADVTPAPAQPGTIEGTARPYAASASDRRRKPKAG